MKKSQKNTHYLLNCGVFYTPAMDIIFGNTPNLKHVYVGSGWVPTEKDKSNLFYLSSISSVTTGMC